MKGVRWINGIEFLLCGRYALMSEALDAAEVLRAEWNIVKVRSTHGTVTCWVHGHKGAFLK